MIREYVATVTLGYLGIDKEGFYPLWVMQVPLDPSTPLTWVFTSMGTWVHGDGTTGDILIIIVYNEVH